MTENNLKIGSTGSNLYLGDLVILGGGLIIGQLVDVYKSNNTRGIIINNTNREVSIKLEDDTNVYNVAGNTGLIFKSSNYSGYGSTISYYNNSSFPIKVKYTSFSYENYSEIINSYNAGTTILPNAVMFNTRGKGVCIIEIIE